VKHLLPAIVYFATAIVVAHFFAPSGYDWTRNTISDLGSQGHGRKWIMQAGFIGFGILLAAGLAWKSHALGRVSPPDSLVLIYGLAILLAGVFCAAPLDGDLAYSVREAQVHSLCATVAGIALSAGILWYGLAAASTAVRIYHLAFLVLITTVSVAFGAAENGHFLVGKGIVQRVLYLVGFVWLGRL
jgi:hypothetical membrane protein